MTLMTTVEILLILFAATGAAVFVISYPALADPRRWTREGRHMWAFTVALLSLGFLGAARRVWPELENTAAYHAALAATFAALGALLWQRVVLLYRAQAEARRRDHHT